MKARYSANAAACIGVAAITHAANNIDLTRHITTFGDNILQMRVIIDAPFWPKHRDYIAAHCDIASVNHPAAGAG